MSARRLLAPIVLLALAAIPAVASDQAAPFESVSLMHAVGTIVVEADGSVGSVAITTKLDEKLRPALEHSLATLRFKPVLQAGAAQRTQNTFDVLLAATRAGGGLSSVVIDNVDFGLVEGAPVLRDEDDYQIEADGQLQAPTYPREALEVGAMGRVLVAVRFNADGSAGEAGVVRSQLYDTGLPEAVGRRSLAQFEKRALAAALQWRAKIVPGRKPPAHGFTAFAPVVYVMQNLAVDLEADGQWLPVKRLPKREIPWARDDAQAARVDDSGRGAGLASANGPLELLHIAKGTPVL